VTIEVVTYDPVADRQSDVGLPIAKVHIPSQKFIGYLQLLDLHPVVPPGEVIQFKRDGNETFELYPSALILQGNKHGVDLGARVSATVIEYDYKSASVMECTLEKLAG
jgi:hypothetical protein